MRVYSVADIRNGTGWPKGQRFVAQAECNAVEMALILALTAKPDHIERVKDPSMPHAYYRVSAYGLTRCDGGYVIVRFVCQGQRDTITAYLFDTWRANVSRDFAVAAGRIDVTRHKLLYPRPEEA